jgi:glucokinase
MGGIACGIDIGGTKLAIGLVRTDGSLMDRETVRDHVDKEEGQVIEDMAHIVQNLLQRNSLQERDLLGIGVVYPGHIRSKGGITIRSSNLQRFRNFPLCKEVQKHFSVPVITDNDANAMAYAELKFGAGAGYSSMIFVTVSSGIGAGIIINNRIYRGMTGTAGEFGHMIVNPRGDIRCGCGNYGCLMTYTCGHALGKVFKKLLVEGKPTKLDIDENTPAREITGETLKKGLDMSDALTMEVVDQCALYMGIGLYNIFQIFNPPLIALGGGLMNLGEYLFDQIKLHFYRLARDMLFDDVIITRSKLKEEAGVIGAASLLLEKDEG